jgi:hypothetical protein
MFILILSYYGFEILRTYFGKQKEGVPFYEKTFLAEILNRDGFVTIERVNIGSPYVVKHSDSQIAAGKLYGSLQKDVVAVLNGVLLKMQKGVVQKSLRGQPFIETKFEKNNSNFRRRIT